MNRREDISRTLSRAFSRLSYTPILGLAVAISLGRLVLYAFLLEVTQFGLTSKLILFSGLIGMFGTLGTQLVAHRDVPRLFHVGESRQAISMLAQCLVVSALVILLCIPFAPLFVRLFDLSLSEILLALCHGFVSQAFLTLTIESKSRLEMMRYARDMLTRSVLLVIAGAIVALAGWGGFGVVAAEAFVTLLLLPWLSVSILSVSGLKWRDLEPYRIKSLPWFPSIVLLAGSLVAYASYNADRWVAASFLTPLDFGHYSFAWIPLQAAQSMQALLNAGIFPLLVRRETVSTPNSALRLAALISAASLAASLLVAAIAWPAANPVIRAWLPKYIEALPIMLPLFGAAAFRASDFWSSYLIAARSEGILLKVQVASLALVLALWALTTTPSYISVAWLACFAAMISHVASATASLLLRVR